MRQGRKQRITRRDLEAMEKPRVDVTRCTGCKLCVEVCPTMCLAMAGPVPWLPRPLDCVSCELCALVCPVQAITLTTG
jgi:formate hydrogenlyase subunit 6/NADH:ubiquinone oxidoreductase subunit I